MKVKLISFLVVFISLFNLVSAGVFISGLNYPKTIDINNENFVFNATLINSDDEVYSNLQVKYSLVNLDNLGLVYENSKQISFANKEVKFFKEEFQVPNVPEGLYSFNFILTEKTGKPIAGMKYDTEITNSGEKSNLPNLKFSIFPHILAKDELGNVIKTSFGSLGNNLPIESQKFISFSLENPTNIQLDTTIEIYHSYSVENKLSEIKKTVNLYSNVTEYLINYDYQTPGTYIVKTTFNYQGSKLFSKELRMVISGESASIVSVKNKQDTYQIGETLNVNGILVGPADGASTLNNLDLKLQVKKNNQLITENSQKINGLAFEPLEFEFNSPVTVPLDKYTLKIILSNSENEILDEIELSYEKIEPQFLYKDGTIYESDFQGCFNNDVCEDFEKELGNCYDCFEAKQNAIAEEKKRYEESIKDNENNTEKETDSKITNVVYSYKFILSVTIILLLIVVSIGYFVIGGIRKNE